MTIAINWDVKPQTKQINKVSTLFVKLDIYICLIAINTPNIIIKALCP